MSENRIIPPGTVLPPLNAAGGAVAPCANEQPATSRYRDASGVGGMRTTHGSRPSKAMAAAGARNRQAGRFRVLNDFVDVKMKNISSKAASAWLVLYRDTKPNGLARTGLADLAKRMGCSVATAKRAIRELKKNNLMSVEVYGRPGRGPNVYKINGHADCQDAAIARPE